MSLIFQGKTDVEPTYWLVIPWCSSGGNTSIGGHFWAKKDTRTHQPQENTVLILKTMLRSQAPSLPGLAAA
eukprot:1797183-Amphidinium_carterae.1